MHLPLGSALHFLNRYCIIIMHTLLKSARKVHVCYKINIIIIIAAARGPAAGPSWQD